MESVTLTGDVTSLEIVEWKEKEGHIGSQRLRVVQMKDLARR